MSFNYNDELKKIIDDYNAHTAAETQLGEDLEKAVDKWRDEMMEEVRKTIHKKSLFGGHPYNFASKSKNHH